MLSILVNLNIFIVLSILANFEYLYCVVNIGEF